MNSTLIYNTGHYLVFSYGNGWAYKVIRQADGKSLWLHSDDATQFRQELENTNDKWTYNHVINQYEGLFGLGAR